MKKRAVIFDMDGLMIDSERVTYDGYVKICSELDYEMTLEYYKSLLGLPVKKICLKLKDYFGADFPSEEIVKKVHIYIEEIFHEEGIPLKKGLLEILQYLKKNNYKMIVATSSARNRVVSILNRAGISEYFEDFICGDEVIKGKPDPETFLKGCEKINVKPEEAYVLEDSEMGILAAFRANIACICVPDMKYPSEEFKERTYKVVDTLLDAIEVIRADERCFSNKKMGTISMFRKFQHVGVISSDYKATIEFYVNILGFTIFRESFSEKMNGQKLELHLQGQYILEVFVTQDAVKEIREKTATGLNHLSFLVDDVNKVITYLKSKGVKTLEVNLDKITGKEYAFFMIRMD